MRYMLWPVLAWLLVTGSADAAAGKLIALRVTPQQSFEPADIRTTITLEPNYLNSNLCLTWDSVDGEAGRHCFDTEGQYIPKTTTFTLTGVTAGYYEFQASVAQGTGWKLSERVPVNVLPKGE